MESKVFRKASVECVNSPEQLNRYIRVTRAGVWIVLILIALFLAAVITLACLGTVETTVTVGVVTVHNDQYQGTWCYATPENAAQIEEGMKIRINGVMGTVKAVPVMPLVVTDDYMAGFAAYCAGDVNNPYVYEIEVDIDGLEDGICTGEVIVDEVRPVTFIIG